MLSIMAEMPIVKGGLISAGSLRALSDFSIAGAGAGSVEDKTMRYSGDDRFSR